MSVTRNRSKSWHTKTKPALIKRFGSEEAWKAHLTEIGRKGAAAGDPKLKGFGGNRELAVRAGRLGGMVGRIGEHKLSAERVAEIKSEYRTK